MKTTRIGIALGESIATVVWRHGGTEHIERFPLPDRTADDSAPIAAVFSAIAEQVPRAGAGQRLSADVALLPPLSDARALRLPPLRAGEAQAVVARDAGRWFVGVPAPRVIAVMPPKRTGAATFAAAAPERTVDAVAAAGRTAGIGVRTIVPAHAAWLACADSANAVAVVHDGVLHAVQLSDGAPTSVRRFAAQEAAADAVTGVGAGAAVVLEDGSATQQAFTSAGWNVTAAGPADVVAARMARSAQCSFEGATMVAERSGRSRRAALSFAAAAVVLLAAAAALHLWGAHHELGVIRDRRAQIRSEVTPLLALRDSVERVTERTRRVDSLAAAAPRWTEALFDLAMLLPPESHLTRLFASGDTLLIDAEGARAGDALQALRSAATLRDARLVGAVDRELADGATTVERFRLRAQLAPRRSGVMTTARADSSAGASR